MTQEELNQKSENEGANFSDQYAGDFYAKQYTFIGYSKGYKAGFSAGVESAQPEWRYVERDGFPDTTLSVDISYTCDGWIGGNLDEAYFMDGLWHKGVTPINPNWRVYAWKMKTYKTAAPLPPAKNQ